MASLDNYTEEELALLLAQIRHEKEYYKLKDFRPYNWQLEFMNASKQYKQRMLRSGNQSGKTVSGGIEFAMHLSGLYQSWYEGERVEGSGHTYWCIGINLDRAADILQKELIGTPDIGIDSDIGKGSIPLHCIDKSSMRKDGKRLSQVRIKHFDADGNFDGYNTLQFFGAHQGQDQFMGSRTKGIWQDEEPAHNSMEIYSQCLTRTTATDGFVMLTLTPEQGRTPLNIKFEEDETGELYLQQASLLDCPHITDEKLNKLKAGWPEYQHEMRIFGIPVIGTGAVFAHVDSAISTDDKHINNWDQILWAIDIGRTNDPTVITLAKRQEVDDGFEVTVIEQYQSQDDRSPVWVNSIISNHLYCKAPVIYPHDASGDGGYASVLRRLGLNIPSKPFHNPAISDADAIGGPASHSRSIEAGLYYMDQYFKEGRLKIHKDCNTWFQEKAGYYRTGKTGTNAYAGEDHAIDRIVVDIKLDEFSGTLSAIAA